MYGKSDDGRDNMQIVARKLQSYGNGDKYFVLYVKLIVRKQLLFVASI